MHLRRSQKQGRPGAVLAAAGLLMLACNASPERASAAPNDGGPCQGSTSLSQAIGCLQEAGVLPVLDTSDDIAGPDVDHNGIRDDIDAYIAKQTYTDAQRKAVQQLARAYQAAVTSNAQTRDAALPLDQQMERAIKCLGERFLDLASFSSARTAIKQVTLNTLSRTQAFLQYNHQLNGLASAEPPGDTCAP